VGPVAAGPYFRGRRLPGSTPTEDTVPAEVNLWNETRS
jgi:hypothetical protein